MGGVFFEDFTIFLRVFSALDFVGKGKGGAEGRNKEDAKSSKKGCEDGGKTSRRSGGRAFGPFLFWAGFLENSKGLVLVALGPIGRLRSRIFWIFNFLWIFLVAAAKKGIMVHSSNNN